MYFKEHKIISKKVSPEEFIRQYKAAIKAKLSKEQFSKILGILPESIIRRRLNIAKQFGLDLPFLPSTSSEDVSQEQIERYYTALQEVERPMLVGRPPTFPVMPDML